MRMQPHQDIHKVVKGYADAWMSNDLHAVFDCYHDDVVFHYFGSSPLAGTHRGKAACLEVLKQVRLKTKRTLVSIQDVLAGERYGLIVAVERFERNGAAVEVQRMFRFSVRDDKLAECWVYDEDQQLIDGYLA